MPFLSGFSGSVDYRAAVFPEESLKESPEDKNEKLYVKKQVGEDQNQWVRIASEISENDIDFLSTVNQENGLWTLDRVSPKNKNGTRDYGLCQLNSTYHWNFIQSDEFKDGRKQLEYCYEVYKKRPTAFYGYYKRKQSYNKFELV